MTFVPKATEMLDSLAESYADKCRQWNNMLKQKLIESDASTGSFEAELGWMGQDYISWAEQYAKDLEEAGYELEVNRNWDGEVYIYVTGYNERHES